MGEIDVYCCKQVYFEHEWSYLTRTNPKQHLWTSSLKPPDECSPWSYRTSNLHPSKINISSPPHHWLKSLSNPCTMQRHSWQSKLPTPLPHRLKHLCNSLVFPLTTLTLGQTLQPHCRITFIWYSSSYNFVFSSWTCSHPLTRCPFWEKLSPQEITLPLKTPFSRSTQMNRHNQSLKLSTTEPIL